MNAGRQRLLIAVIIAGQAAGAACGAEIRLSLSYAGSLASDGVTPIGSALDPRHRAADREFGPAPTTSTISSWSCPGWRPTRIFKR